VYYEGVIRRKGGYKTEMATLSELIKGFRSNVREGIPTEIAFDGEYIRMNARGKKGFVGICKPSIRLKTYRVYLENGEMPQVKATNPVRAAEVAYDWTGRRSKVIRVTEVISPRLEAEDLPDILTYSNTGIARPS